MGGGGVALDPPMEGEGYGLVLDPPVGEYIGVKQQNKLLHKKLGYQNPHAGFFDVEKYSSNITIKILIKKF